MSDLRNTTAGKLSIQRPEVPEKRNTIQLFTHEHLSVVIIFYIYKSCKVFEVLLIISLQTVPYHGNSSRFTKGKTAFHLHRPASVSQSIIGTVSPNCFFANEKTDLCLEHCSFPTHWPFVFRHSRDDRLTLLIDHVRWEDVVDAADGLDAAASSHLGLSSDVFCLMGRSRHLATP